MTNIAVIVALSAYHSLSMLKKCLASLEAQTFPRVQMQIVVGDNGSTYGTREMIKS